MRPKAALIGSLVAAAGLLSWVVAAGCSSKDNNTTRSSQKGEECQTTNDCANNLACVPNAAGTGGVCEINKFNVPANPKSCTIIQCATASDCCTPLAPQSQCMMYAQLCNDGGDPFYCQQYKQLCTCDTSRIQCNNGQCTSICRSDNDCLGNPSGNFCSASQCVQCRQDSDCPPGNSCQSGSCQAPCQSDGDCPAFNRCNNGACTQSGCQTDFECVSATRHVDATCDAGGCVVACQSDIECGNPQDYNFYSCINHSCTYVGCTSDKDCELAYTHGADASPLGGKQHFACQ
jgi:Cys-rich repeat protein